MSFKKTICAAIVLSSFLLAGCQSNADYLAADVYDANQLNSTQETTTVTILSVLPAKVAMDNTANKKAAQAFGTLPGAVAGGVAGAAAGSLVSDKTMVEAVSLSYKSGTKVLSSTQVGKSCLFTPGLAVMISTKENETRIQPNAKCPEKNNGQ